MLPAQLPGADVRLLFLHSLSSSSSGPRGAAVAFGALLREMSADAPFSPTEGALAAEVLCRGMRRLASPDELPPLVHHMTWLCKRPAEAAMMLDELAEFFSRRMKKVAGGGGSSESSQGESEDLLAGGVGLGCLETKFDFLLGLFQTARLKNYAYFKPRAPSLFTSSSPQNPASYRRKS